jgi:hypothetical protein
MWRGSSTPPTTAMLPESNAELMDTCAESRVTRAAAAAMALVVATRPCAVGTDLDQIAGRAVLDAQLRLVESAASILLCCKWCGDVEHLTTAGSVRECGVTHV